MNKNTVYITISVVFVVAFIFVLLMWLKPSNEVSTNSVTPVATSAMPPADRQDAPNTHQHQTIRPTDTQVKPSTRFKTGLEALPHSLQGSQVDGEIIIDGNKQLVVTEGLRHLFDYFLSTLGEESESVIMARVEAYIRHHTPEPAASDAVNLFYQYVEYLKALNNIADKYSHLQMQKTQDYQLDLDMLATRNQDVANLRNSMFDSQTIEAFFGTEDALDEYNIQMVRIAQDDTLSDAQKHAQRQEVISRLPDNETKKRIEQEAVMSQLMTRTEALKSRNASEVEIYQMRRELVGEAAAQRLAQVDAEEKDFDSRFELYQARKQSLIANTDTNTEDAMLKQSQAISQLEQELFSDSERKRLTGYALLKQSRGEQSRSEQSQGTPADTAP